MTVRLCVRARSLTRTCQTLPLTTELILPSLSVGGVRSLVDYDGGEW